MAGTDGTWVPPSERVGDDYNEEDSLAAKFERMAKQSAEDQRAFSGSKDAEKAPDIEPEGKAPGKKKSNVPKVKVSATLETSSLFAVQKSTIAAEESHIMTCEAKGQAFSHVHPSQVDDDEGDEAHMPGWRAQQVKENEREHNATYDLPARQAARVKERAKAKREAERAAKAKIAAGLPGVEVPEHANRPSSTLMGDAE